MAEDAFGEHYLTRLMNVSLAERLHIRLREELGYTYFIDAAFDGNADAGHFLLQSSVRSRVTRAALRQILQELDKYQRLGPTRLECAPCGIGCSMGRRSITRRCRRKWVHAAHPAQGVARGLCGATGAAGEPALSFTLRELARRWLDPDDMVILVVGDAKTLAPELAALGWPVQRLSATP